MKRPGPSLSAALLASGIALAGYAFTFARTVTLVDSGELILTSATFGVAHPPGIPLYTLLGFLFTRVPIGAVAARMACFSSLFGAAAAALVAGIVLELASASPDPRREALRGRRKRVPEGLPPQPLPAILPAVAAGLTFAFSITLWFYASVAEVYTLNIALVAAMWLLLLRWRREEIASPGSARAVRLLAAAAAAFGLGLCVHYVTVGLTFFAAAWLALRTAGRRLWTSRDLAWAAAAATAPLLLYGLLPIAAHGSSPLAWGNPDSVRRLFWHVSAKQYQVNLFAGTAQEAVAQLQRFGGWLLLEQTPLALLAAAAGLVWIRRRSRVLFWALSAIVVLDVAYTVNYDIAEDRDAYYLTTFLILAATAGVGLEWLVSWARSRRAALAATALCVIIPAASYALHFRQSTKRRDLVAHDYVANALVNVAPGGLLLTADWQFYSPYLYRRYFEGFRPDARVVNLNLLRRSWYVGKFLPNAYPEMMARAKGPAEGFLREVRPFEEGRPYDTARLDASFHALIEALISQHEPGPGAAMMLPAIDGVATRYEWVPQGLGVRLYADHGFHPDEPQSLELRTMRPGVYLDEVARGKVRGNYAAMSANRAKYLLVNGLASRARPWIDEAIAIDPESDRAWTLAGDLDAGLKRTAQARHDYEKAIELNPENADARRALATLGR